MIRYHHGLGEGLFYDNLTISRSFLAYGKNVDQAITFPFRFLFDAKILVKDCYRANRQPEYRHSVKLFFVILLVRLEIRRKTFWCGGSGCPWAYSATELAQPWLWRLPCGIFPPRQVLGYPYCGIFAICASAFGGISTLCEGCRKGGVMLPITQEKIVLLNTAWFEAL